MSKILFGNNIRMHRAEIERRLSKVATNLYIDTSTRSKVERDKHANSPHYLKTLSQILKLDLTGMQTTDITGKQIKSKKR